MELYPHSPSTPSWRGAQLKHRDNVTLLTSRHTQSCTWCGYEVPGMILLRDFKAAMPLDRIKDMSVHVSTCISYDFNALTPVVWKLWR
jgi:hypothetical protein